MPDYTSIDPGLGGINTLILYLSKLPPQRSNRYKVSFSGLDSSIVPAESLPFWATMVQIPSASVRFFPDSVGPYTPTWKVPLKHEVDDRFIVEFMVDEKHQVRKLIHAWMKNLGINDSSSKYGAPMFNTRVSNLVRDTIMTITPLPTDLSKPVDGTNYPGTIVLEQVYPKLILPSEFNTDNPNPLRLQVDFNYRTFKIDGVPITGA